MMQNGLGESFWDANGVEIVACAKFTDFPGIRDNLPDPTKMPDPRKNIGLDALARVGISESEGFYGGLTFSSP